MAIIGEQYRYEAPRPLVSWTETLIGTLIVPMLGLLFHRHDPLFLQSAFPWMIFAPLLFGVRYGFVHGFVSALLLIGLMLLAWNIGDGQAGFPYQYALATALVGMLTGEFADVWLRRLGRMQLINDYAGSRLSEFTRSYQLLKLSHDQLEERLADQRHNVRNALQDLKRKFINSADRNLLREQGSAILDFVAVHGLIQQGALYEVDADRKVSTTPLATLGGTAQAIDPEHPMVRASLENGELVSLRTDGMEQVARQARQGIMAVVPLTDVTGRIWALITVTQMPFIVFHNRNLTMLAVIGATLADAITDARRHVVPDEQLGGEDEFRKALAVWISYSRRFQIDSSVVSVTATGLDDASLSAVENTVLEQMRTLDVGLRIERTDRRVRVAVLMPLTRPEGVKGYQRRMESILSQRLDRRDLSGAMAFDGFDLANARGDDDLLRKVRQAS